MNKTAMWMAFGRGLAVIFIPDKDKFGGNYLSRVNGHISLD